MSALLRILLVLLAACSALPAQADELRPGYLELTQQDARHWQVVWKAPLIGGLASRARPTFPPFCTLAPGTVRLEANAVLSTGTLDCSQALNGSTVGLSGLDKGYTDALLRIAPLGRRVQAERLTAKRPKITVQAVKGSGQVAWTYFKLGVIHILEGYDHLVFVIALVLLLAQLWTVVKAATAFTVAHSITLVGTTLGLFGLAQAPVEALIALSIVFLAVEIVKLDPETPRLSQRIPWIVAFLFGLLHGFGFAGALREIGLPESDVPLALLTFNLGVEAGQLLIIAASLSAIVLLRRYSPGSLRRATVASAYAIGTVASFWFIERMIG